jgi:hypothetical protein
MCQAQVYPLLAYAPAFPRRVICSPLLFCRNQKYRTQSGAVMLHECPLSSVAASQQFTIWAAGFGQERSVSLTEHWADLPDKARNNDKYERVKRKGIDVSKPQQTTQTTQFLNCRIIANTLCQDTRETCDTLGPHPAKRKPPNFLKNLRVLGRELSVSKKRNVRHRLYEYDNRDYPKYDGMTEIVRYSVEHRANRANIPFNK